MASSSCAGCPWWVGSVVMNRCCWLSGELRMPNWYIQVLCITWIWVDGDCWKCAGSQKLSGRWKAQVCAANQEGGPGCVWSEAWAPLADAPMLSAPHLQRGRTFPQDRDRYQAGRGQACCPCPGSGHERVDSRQTAGWECAVSSHCNFSTFFLRKCSICTFCAKSLRGETLGSDSRVSHHGFTFHQMHPSTSYFVTQFIHLWNGNYNTHRPHSILWLNKIICGKNKTVPCT